MASCDGVVTITWCFLFESSATSGFVESTRLKNLQFKTRRLHFASINRLSATWEQHPASTESIVDTGGYQSTKCAASSCVLDQTLHDPSTRHLGLTDSPAQVYKGKDEILLSKLILEPSHSILTQSYDSRLRLVSRSSSSAKSARSPSLTLSSHPIPPSLILYPSTPPPPHHPLSKLSSRTPRLTPPGHPPPAQRRRLRRRVLHIPGARPVPMPVHVHDPRLELHQPVAAGRENDLVAHLRARARHDVGRARGRQLPPVPAPDADVHAQRQHRGLAGR